MNVKHFVYSWEHESMQLRYSEGLTRQQIADRLILRFAQVKYIFSKPNVKHYIRTEIMPALWKRELAVIEEGLTDPIISCVGYLVERTKAQTYQWFGPGCEVYCPNNKARLQAAKKIGRILGVVHDQKTWHRDIKIAVCRRAEALMERRDILRAHLALVHKN